MEIVVRYIKNYQANISQTVKQSVGCLRSHTTGEVKRVIRTP